MTLVAYQLVYIHPGSQHHVLHDFIDLHCDNTDLFGWMLHSGEIGNILSSVSFI